jgi:hypothetical protein
MFCGELLADLQPILELEAGWNGGEYATFAAHPRCFMAAAHQSIRNEAHFDQDTSLPISELPAWPAEADTGGLVPVAQFEPPDARSKFRSWRRTNSALLNDLPAQSIRVDTGLADGGEIFRIWLAPDAAPRARLDE